MHLPFHSFGSERNAALILRFMDLRLPKWAKESSPCSRSSSCEQGDIAKYLKAYVSIF